MNAGPFRIWSKDNLNEVHSGEPHPEGRQVLLVQMQTQMQMQFNIYTNGYNIHVTISLGGKVRFETFLDFYLYVPI